MKKWEEELNSTSRKPALQRHGDLENNDVSGRERRVFVKAGVFTREEMMGKQS